MAGIDDMQELAAQLRLPTGDGGLEVANMMHASNQHMIRHAIAHLQLGPQHQVLEPGHGNGAHLPEMLDANKSIRYFGLEMSPLMQEEARRINETFVKKQSASFHLYDGQHIPFQDHSFDRVFTVNTLYFWVKPVQFLHELYRVIKPGGKMNITFAQKTFMEQMPFTAFGFELYDTKKLEQLIDTSSFRIAAIHHETEILQSRNGSQVERAFTTFSLDK